MPLVDLKTDLRSIRFGSPDAPGDRPNGAWSNQPYITTPIGADFLAPTPNRFAIGKGSDFILRGGASAFVDATTDVLRLGKMFTDLKTPNGIQFVAKQELLSMTGVNIFAGYPTSVRALNRARLNDGVYTPLSALLAAGPVGNLIGGHPNKQGLDPTGNSLRYSRPQYTNLVNRDEGSEKRNRLLNLDKKFIKNNKTGHLFSYLGGPNAGADVASVNTIIHFPKDQITSRTGMANPLSVIKPYLFFGRGGGTLTGNQQANLSNNSFRTTGKVRDFRKLVTSQTIGVLQHTLARQNGTLTNAPNYNDKYFEKRVNAGNPGNPLFNRSNYSSGAIDPTTNRTNVVNKINALYMYNANNVTDNPDSKNDFVKFRFAVINPDTPKKKTFVHFPAFFDGAITDNMGANWSSFKYLGRGEEFFNYEGFSRDVSFGFQVVAQSKPELSIMYQKLNYLQSTLAPNFSTNGFMRGNIHQLTIGGYFYEQPGVITSLNYTMPSESPWEIGIPSSDSSTIAVGGIDYRDPSVKELTHIINVSVSFKPIQRFLPQTVGSPFDTTNPNGIFGKQAINQKFIQLANGGGIGENLYDLGLPDAIIQPNEFETELVYETPVGIEDEDEETDEEFTFVDILAQRRAADADFTRLELLDRG